MSGLTLAFISFIRRPVSSFLAVMSLIIPLVTVGLALTLLVSSRESLQKYDTSVDAILGPKSPDLALLMSSLFGVGHEDRLIPHGLLRHAREPMDKKENWMLPDESEGDSIDVVKQATPFMDFAEYKNYKVLGTDNTFLERPDDNMNPPKVAEGSWFGTSGQVVAGSLVAEGEDLRPGSTITAKSRLLHPESGKPLWQKELTITGILEPTGIVYDRMLYTSQSEPFELYRTAIPLNLMRETRNNMGMSYALLWLYNGQEKRLQDFFDHYTVAKTIILQEQMEWIERLFGGGESLLKFVSGITIVLAMLCVMVLFNARYEAMTEDLAIIRALGYGKPLIMAWLLWESLFIWLSAMPFALLIEGSLTGLLGEISNLSIFHIEWLWPTPLHPWMWGFVFISGPLSLIIPLIRLYRHNLHDALKGM